MTHKQVKEIHKLTKATTVQEAKEMYNKVQQKINRLEADGSDADETALEYWRLVQLSLHNRITGA